MAFLVAACHDSPGPVAPNVADPALSVGGPQDRLAAWFERASPAVLALPAAVFADHDEANGRLVFGVENAAAVRGIETALAAIGVPESAYDVQVTVRWRRWATGSGVGPQIGRACAGGAGPLSRARSSAHR